MAPPSPPPPPEIVAPKKLRLGAAAATAMATAAPTRAAVAAAAIAAARRAGGRLLTDVPMDVLDNVVELLGDRELALAAGAGPAIRAALAAGVAAGADYCAKQTGCGARCEELVTRVGALAPRCRRDCWRALALRVARGIALWDEARSHDEARTRRVDSRYGLWETGTLARFGAFAAEYAAALATADEETRRAAAENKEEEEGAGEGAEEEKEKAAARAAGAMSVEVAWSQRWLYLRFRAAGTFRDLLAIAHGAAVRAAVLRAQTLLLRDESIHHAAPHQTQLRAEEALAREGEPHAAADEQDPEDDAEERQVIDGLVDAEFAPRGLADLAVARPADAYTKLGYTPAVRAAVLDGYLALLRARSASGGAPPTRRDAPELAAAELIAELRAALHGVDALYPSFGLLDSSAPGWLPADRPIELLLAVDLTLGRVAVRPATLAAVLPLLQDRGLLARAPVRRWLRLGAREFHSDRPAGPNGGAGEHAVASADAPPALPLDAACAGADRRKLMAAAFSPAAALHYATLPHDISGQEEEAEGQAAGGVEAATSSGEVALLVARRAAERGTPWPPQPRAGRGSAPRVVDESE